LSIVAATNSEIQNIRKKIYDRRRLFQVQGPAGLSAIESALGSGLVALYDGRVGVTSSAGVVSNWSDARGAGFGPALVATGTAQPSYNGTNKLTFDGVDDFLTCASAYAGFDVSGPCSLFFIGFSTAGLANFAAIADSASAFRLLSAEGGSDYNVRAGNPNISISSTVAPGTTPLLIVVSSASGTANIDVPNKTRVSGAITQCAAGANFLSVGTYSPTGGGFAPCTCYAIGVLSRVATAGDLSALAAYAQVLGATLQ